MRRLRRVDAVIFDCDSTLTAIEGIDELAHGQDEAVAALTEAAMLGTLPLESVYERRLQLVRPDRAALAALGRRYVEMLVPDALEVVRALQFEGLTVRIVSGGLLPAVLDLARALGLPAEAVAAVAVSFDETGGYQDYDRRSPLARAGGKRELLELWRHELRGPLMLVGDGATDAEAATVADLFVAFAGVVERAAVVGVADVVVRANTLAPILPLALGGAPPRAAATLRLYEKGLALLDDELRARLSFAKV